MDAIISWILEHWPVLGAIVVVGVIVWFISQYVAKIEYSRKKIEALPCEAHKSSIESLVTMNTTVDSINEQITEISKWIMHIDDRMIDQLTRKCSPRVMTAVGKQLFELSGANQVMKDNAIFLISEVEKKKPSTPYDVEDMALNVLLGNLSLPMFDPIKNYIYYQPESIVLKNENGEDCQIRLSLNAIIRLMGIKLRDLYLVKHPEVIPED